MINNLICQECPNGCSLIVEWSDEFHAVIAGNQCSRGVGYVGRILRQDKKIYVLSKEKMPSFSTAALQDIALLWGIKVAGARYDISVQGSPERSAFRVVVEDEEKKLFVMEQLLLKSLAIKKNIARTLEFLSERKLRQVKPYIPNAQGEAIVKYKSSFWQIMPFISGVELDRAKYMDDAWRGPVLAKFLIDLREKSKDIPFFNPQRSFSLKDYIDRLVGHVKMYKTSLREEVVGVMDFLEKEFMPSYAKLPVAFCHGDYHPMNIIWSEDDIHCVIDWEFTGYKSEIYDVANLIGCVGVEDPLALTGEFIQSFIAAMQKARIISDVSWDCLVQFIVALRFAWLSEWLRRRDEEMITLEMDYMRLLMENKKALRESWQL